MNSEINTALRNHQVARSESLAVLHRYLHPIIDRFYPDVPLPALSLSRDHWRTLGWYMEEDGLSLCHRININTLHTNRPLPEIIRTLTHEVGHCWQRIHGKPANPSPENYHNRQFQKKMSSIGIPCNKRGVSLGFQEPFIGFLNGLGIEANSFPFKRESTAPKSRSRLKAWTCGCTRVWASGGVEVLANCLKCGNPFQPTPSMVRLELARPLLIKEISHEQTT